MDGAKLSFLVAPCLFVSCLYDTWHKVIDESSPGESHVLNGRPLTTHENNGLAGVIIDIEDIVHAVIEWSRPSFDNFKMIARCGQEWTKKVCLVSLLKYLGRILVKDEIRPYQNAVTMNLDPTSHDFYVSLIWWTTWYVTYSTFHCNFNQSKISVCNGPRKCDFRHLQVINATRNAS